MNLISVTIKLQAVHVVLCLFIVVVLGTTNKICNFNSLRLPERVKPIHYDLLLRLTDVAAATYEGQVKINVTFGQLQAECLPSARRSLANMITFKRGPAFGCDQSEIVLNANRRVHIREARLILDTQQHQTRETIESHEICRDYMSEMASIRFDRSLEDNSNGQLIIDFYVDAGESPAGLGLYRSVWGDKSRNQSYVSFVTHFEPASARKALPCFDEPTFKSTFDVAIEHDKDYTALSNAKAINEQPVDGWPHLIRTHFDRTPVMSTYLLAVAVGQYEHLESRIMDEKMLLRVFTPPGQQERGRIALDIGRRAYAALHEYFEIEQPVEKIDFLPVKMGFGGAMENWGLVTYKDKTLLSKDAEANDTSGLSTLAVTISHELAHQWFGNLVTMKWWDNLWLNEAFAQWLGYIITDQILPELNVKIGMVEQMMKGLLADTDPKSSHPIKNPKLKSIKDIQDSFDKITYFKGGAVMAMLEGYIGHENFKLAIRDYLMKFKYMNTDENDLWTALEAHSELPVAKMMDSWLNQAGFPLVTVQFASGGKNRISVRQHKFGSDSTWFGSNKQLWIIPIRMLVVRGDEPGVDESQVIQFILNDEEFGIDLPDWFDASKGHWFKLNHNAEGFFRVHYKPEVMRLLQKPIKSKQMNLLDRMNIIDDLSVLCLNNIYHSTASDEILNIFYAEDNQRLIIHLARLVLMNPTSSVKLPLLINYFNELMVKDMKSLSDETIQDRFIKQSVLQALIAVKYQPAVEFGRKTLAGMSQEARSSWPQLEDLLKKC